MGQRKTLGQTLAGIFFCAMVCVSASAQSVDAPTFSVGDTWKFKRTDADQFSSSVNFQTHRVAARDGAGKAWVYLENVTTDFKSWWLFDEKKGANIGTYAFNAAAPNTIGQLQKENSQDSRLQFPLYVGKKYQVTESSNPDGPKTTYDIEVVGPQRLKTPAGEFAAWKLQASGKQVDDAGVTRPGRSGELWYSPQAKRFIKTVFTYRKSTSTFELIEWTPGAK